LPYTGLRPKEVRLGKLADFDLDKRRIRVSSPKGDGRWASREQFAPFPSEAHAAFEDFVVERDAYLAGERCDWLIPLRGLHSDHDHEPTLGPWSDASLRKLKSILQRRSGVEFRGLKTFRA